MRQRSGAIVCPNCKKLINVDERRCPYCQALRPGLWGFAPAVRKLFGGHVDLVVFLVGFCLILYGLTLLLDPHGIRYAGLMDFMSPSSRMLKLFGMTGGSAWALGHWWTVFTYIFLHGSLIHVGFNMMWVMQLGRACEDLFGNAWTFSIFVLSGVAGGLVSNLAGPVVALPTIDGGHVLAVVPTVGASGSVFGLLGAMLAWGKRRGGSFGRGLSQQMWGYVVVLFLFGFMVPGVNNLAHGGGFVAGFVIAWLLPLDRASRSGRPAQVLALGLGAMIVFAFARSILYWAPLFFS